MNYPSLTERQKSIIVGTALGDGHLRLQGRCIQCALYLGHGGNQLDYLKWKHEELSSITNQSIRYYTSRPTARIYSTKPTGQFSTLTHPFLTELKHETYQDGKRIISQQIINRLTPLAIAVWYMDDGGLYYRKNRYGSSYPLIMLATQRFDYDSQERVAAFFKDTYQIRFHIHREKDIYWRLVASDGKSVKSLIQLVEPYIIPCMAFKVRATCL